MHKRPGPDLPVRKLLLMLQMSPPDHLSQLPHLLRIRARHPLVRALEFVFSSPVSGCIFRSGDGLNMCLLSKGAGFLQELISKS